MEKKRAFVVDDGDRALNYKPAYRALLKAGGQIPVELSVPSFITGASVLEVQGLQKEVDAPILGIHCVIDGNPDHSGDGARLFGEEGLLARTRKRYEAFQGMGDSLGILALILVSAITSPYLIPLITKELEEQINTHCDLYKQKPVHINTHNGWWFNLAVMSALQQVAEHNGLPVRINRGKNRMPGIVNYFLPLSPMETGIVIDEHNIPRCSDVTKNPTKFLKYLDQFGPSGEVIMHLHGNLEPQYKYTPSLLRNSSLRNLAEQRGIVFTSSHDLLRR